MKATGRPSKEASDFKNIVRMAEIWRPDKLRGSVQKISKKVVGLEPMTPGKPPKYSLKQNAEMKPKPTSTAKRLERRFLKLLHTGEALKLSAYLIWRKNFVIILGEMEGLDYNLDVVNLESRKLLSQKAIVQTACELMIEPSRAYDLIISGKELEGGKVHPAHPVFYNPNMRDTYNF